ncbi:MAG: fumarylacetoacetate hydrolase family protein [Burkholderiales bacterium]
MRDRRGIVRTDGSEPSPDCRRYSTKAGFIALASQAMALQPGDLIYTGTPAGVAEICIQIV